MDLHDLLSEMMQGDTALTGALMASVGFLIATARESWQRRAEQREQDDNTIGAIRDEIEINRELVRSHRHLIERELELLDNGQRMVNPLDPLATGFWDIIKFNPPSNLPGETLALSRDVARLTVQFNEILRSRELFRVASPLLTMDAFTDDGRTEPAWVGPLRGYDELLWRFLGELAESMRLLGPEIGLAAMEATPAATTESASQPTAHALASFGAVAASAPRAAPVGPQTESPNLAQAFAALAARAEPPATAAPEPAQAFAALSEPPAAASPDPLQALAALAARPEPPAAPAPGRPTPLPADDDVPLPSFTMTAGEPAEDVGPGLADEWARDAHSTQRGSRSPQLTQ